MINSLVNQSIEIPNTIFSKWQKLIDLLSISFNLPATLIMKLDGENIEVFAKSEMAENPYKVGDREKLYGLYCNTVIETQNKLLIPNAQKDKNWMNNPDVKLGMIAYLGFPIYLPNNIVFGTICVLDKEENFFPKELEQLLLQIKEIIELDIAGYLALESKSLKLEDRVREQIRIIDQSKKIQKKTKNQLNKEQNIRETLNINNEQLNKKLQESELRYRSFFNSIELGIVIFEPIYNIDGDLEDLRYIDMNPVNEKIINLKKEQLLGKKHSDFFPETHKRFLSLFESITSTSKGKQFENFYSLSSKYYTTSIFPIGEDLFAFTCFDITNSVLSKHQLEASEKRHKSIFNNSSSSIILIDSDSGAILDSNDAFSRYTGYSKNSLLKMDISHISTSSKEEIKKQLYLAKHNNKKYFEFKHRFASEEIRNVEAYVTQIEVNEKIALHCTIHDITDKKKALQEVLKLSNAVEQSPVSIVITDTNGNIEYSNPKNCEITGYSAKILKGKNPKILKSGKLAEHTYEDLWSTILSGEKWEGEFYNRKNNGSFYWEYASIVPIKNDQGTIINFLKIGRDITEQKKIQSELREAKLKAEENDRLKTAFLANLSHEIRTPLNGIIGFTDLILSEDTPNDAKKEYGSIVQESGEQLLMIINDLVNISQIEAGELNIKLTHFSVTDLLDEILLFYKPEIVKKGLEIHISKRKCPVKESGTNFMLYSDQKRLRQVFDNLIKNAIKFTRKGTITLGAECRDSTVLFTVQDTGIGISSENQKLIFDRFRQVEEHFTRLYGGNGLGLSISKEITELLGGELWVESDVGKGSKFSFTVASNK